MKTGTYSSGSNNANIETTFGQYNPPAFARKTGLFRQIPKGLRDIQERVIILMFDDKGKPWIFIKTRGIIPGDACREPMNEFYNLVTWYLHRIEVYFVFT